jgi:hypothetical protein
MRTSFSKYTLPAFFILCLMASSAFADGQWNANHTVAIFYPTNMTYVDRASALEDFGSDPFLKVGDERGDPFKEGNVTYFNAVNATRTYMRFSNADLSELSGYTITDATLNMRLSNVYDGAGNATTYDTINVRQVTGANSYGYISGLTWDGQADRGVSFEGGMLFADRNFNVTGESNGWKEWEIASSGGGTITTMIEGWMANSSTNYGVLVENDFDGGWAELVNGTKYSINNPSQMNELEAVFMKEQGNYPFLRVQVVPEPISSVLMLVGFGVLGMARKRKKS